MSLKGGYQIINLKNREFSTTRNNMEYYKDIFFNLLNSHAKMIIVSGLNMDGVKYNDYETIFYEVEQPDDNPYFQCIARRIWNTKDYKCITKYINIYYDDRVMCTQEEFTYEILPDGEMSLTSTNALQNKVITKEIKTFDKQDEIIGIANCFINGENAELSLNGNVTSYHNGITEIILRIPADMAAIRSGYINNIIINNYYSDNTIEYTSIAIVNITDDINPISIPTTSCVIGTYADPDSLFLRNASGDNSIFRLNETTASSYTITIQFFDKTKLLNAILN